MLDVYPTSVGDLLHPAGMYPNVSDRLTLFGKLSTNLGFAVFLPLGAKFSQFFNAPLGEVIDHV